MKRLLLAAFVVLTLSACSAPGPMQTKIGLLKTPAFDPIFISSLNSAPSGVEYKTYTVMFRDKMPAMAMLKDTLVITNEGVYLSEWDIRNYTFIHKLKLPYADIKTVETTTKERSFLPDSQYLKIITKTDSQYNFAIFDGSVNLASSLIRKRTIQ